jgi:3-deoxy-D-manno-octulosonic-acid transferase
MTRFAYTTLLRLLAPLIWTWMKVRASKAGGDWEIFGAERFGRIDRRIHPGITHRARIWIHAVSLGETRAAQPLIQALLDDGHSLLLTHTTATGRAEGERLFSEALRSSRLMQAWLPYDFPGATRRFLSYFMPHCGILIEREVWPNLIHQASKLGIPMVLVSARFSASSQRQARWAGRALRQAYAALDFVAAQTPSDAERLKQAGAHNPHVLGNLKFDVSLPIEQLHAGLAWKQSLGRAVVTVASTREGEDALFTDLISSWVHDVTAASVQLDDGQILSKQGAGSVLHTLVPRHPQRFAPAAALLHSHGLVFSRRSAGNEIPPPDAQVLLGDSLGEMAFFYAASDVAVIAGGFMPLGGQNLIEACVAGTPVIVGPHMHNFAQATQDAVEAGAAIQVSDAREAMREAWALLKDEPRREQMRAAALKWTAAHAGATRRILDALAPWLAGTPEKKKKLIRSFPG